MVCCLLWRKIKENFREKIFCYISLKPEQMSKLFPFYYLVFFAITVSAQQTINRRINFNPIDKDSLNLPLNEQFKLIEDSCATIMRHVRFNFDTRKFYGPFTDVRKDNPAVTLTEGYYNADGLKEGLFIIRYASGNIKAKGNFKDDAFDGKWEMYYDNGKPELNFEVKDGVYSVTAAWDEKGNKTIDKGNGSYIADMSYYLWKGKLVDGRPDGTWKMYQSNDPDKMTIATEHFKKGEFIDGRNKFGPYINESRIRLVNEGQFPFVNAEKLLAGAPCNISGPGKGLVNAHYKGGMDAFNYDLRNALTGFFNHVNLDGKEGRFDIVGDISTTGHIENLVRKGGSNIDEVASGIMRIIHDLPKLIPATLNGKLVTEQFKLELDLSKGSYTYTFQFLPVKFR